MKKTPNPEKSVRDEQFGAEENASETSALLNDETASIILTVEDKLPEQVVEEETIMVEETKAETTEVELPVDDQPVPAEGDAGSEVVAEEVKPKKRPTVKKTPKLVISAKPLPEPEAELEVKAVTDTPSDPEIPAEDMYKDIRLPQVDYSTSTKNDLAETLSLIVENRPVNEIRDDVERIRILFYKKHKAEAEEQKEKFLAAGGKLEEFRPGHDDAEKKVRSALDKYREKRSDQGRVLEAEKHENLKKKYEIIEKIKDLANREESINKTFHEFRNLQNEWHSIGIVPQLAIKDLWENYHHNVEIFYDYIKINKELRDLDLRKNLESKISLCEKAEELLMEPSAVNAFRMLQEFHNSWREIGPVPHESKNEVWERFKEATAKINKRHHEFFESQKDSQRKNFEAKIAICDKVEEINLQEIKSFHEFEEKSNEIVQLQKMWRTIGFAPKKYNNKVYQRFREACDSFFEKKRAFYSENKDSQLENLQKKTDLCIQAESFMESTDWKTSTDSLIKLQKAWKEIGPVPRKQSEKIWKRFRKACDYFFEKKSSHFSEVDTSYTDNLNAKKALIEELNNFDPAIEVKEAFEKLKDIQRRWTSIGYVPFNVKEEINLAYKKALNVQFDRLNIDDEDKNILKYKNKLDSVRTDPKLARKVRGEREKFYTRIRQLESDITLWENNIGFFAKSKTADSMISEVREKIENARKTIRILEEKVKMIDHTGLDE